MTRPEIALETLRRFILAQVALVPRDRRAGVLRDLHRWVGQMRKRKERHE